MSALWIAHVMVTDEAVYRSATTQEALTHAVNVSERDVVIVEEI